MPGAAAVTNPVKEPMDAIDGALLVHPPPLAASLSVAAPPTQRLVVPVIANIGFTTIEVVMVQPVGATYEMATVPAAIPVKKPDEALIVAMAELPLVHAPPAVLLLNVVLLPWHTAGLPVMGVGAFTVTVVLAVQPAAVA